MIFKVTHYSKAHFGTIPCIPCLTYLFGSDYPAEAPASRNKFEGVLLSPEVYLELGAYAWGGTLNQPSGTITERLAKAKADPKLFVNREIFNQFSAAREAEFEEKLAKLRASSR